MRSRWWLAVLVAAVLAVPASAQAQRESEPLMQASLALGWAAWHHTDPAACPLPGNRLTITEGRPEVPHDPGVAWAEIRGCRMWAAPEVRSLPPAGQCDLLGHEVGHILGYSHSGGKVPTDADGAVTTPLWDANPLCHVFDRPDLEREADRAWRLADLWQARAELRDERIRRLKRRLVRARTTICRLARRCVDRLERDTKRRPWLRPDPAPQR